MAQTVAAAVDYEVLELDKLFGSMGIENSKLKHLQSQKKLCLILDLDHTLIHASDECNFKKTAGNSSLGNVDDVFLLNFWTIKYAVKLRPFVRKFLKEASKLFEMYIYTLAGRDYARAVAKVLDPEGVYFGSRIISSEESTDAYEKSLDVLPNVNESFVLILDDLKHVWPKYSRNLILMNRYVYFDPPNSVFSDETEGSGALVCALEVLKEVHTLYFKRDNLSVDCDVRDLLELVLNHSSN
ncbi:RNA polymerase II C-terminal domain phosphatase-like 4 [Apium graveolens]|uniref:RNA polymerase II C-terminal domain phosphatase-like 4 n=1 Tax=Apium graveolens TaxID=4045 RepID=UPI003D7A79EE